jgi:hypothetical protein
MKNMWLAFLVVSAGLFLFPNFAEAHHGWLEFDANREITLHGVVTDFHFTNPHCVVEFDAIDEKGVTHKWQGEFSNPRQLTQKGWSASTVGTGDKITISGNPAKSNAPAMHVSRIQLPNGQEYKIVDGR